MSPGRAAIKSVLSSVGLFGSAQRLKTRVRRVKWKAQAHGFLSWDPLVPEEAFLECAANSISVLKAREHVFGDYLEFGVSRGTSFACMHHALESAGLSEVRLFRFDSFEGLPPESAAEGWQPGRYASSEAATRRYLDRQGVLPERTCLVKGWFQDVLTDSIRTSLSIEKASLAMIDCDIFTASSQALSFLTPLIKDETVILFDDWGWREQAGEKGQKEAFSEWLARDPTLTALPLRSYHEHARVFMVIRNAQCSGLPDQNAAGTAGTAKPLT